MESMGVHMRWVRFSLPGALIALLTASGMPTVLAAAELPFQVTAAVRQKVVQEQAFDGVVEAVHQSTVSAQTSGRIAEIYFDVDDYVPKGSIILRFRNAEQQARLTQAQAALREAEARYREAQAEYERIKGVFERKLVAKSAMDKASAEFKSAQARLEGAKGRVAEAQEQMEHTVVRAPYSGIMVKRHVEIGEMANPGQPLVTGLSLEDLRVVVDVPQQFVESVRTNGKARVLLRDGVSVEVSKLTVFPYADNVTHTFRVRVNLAAGQQGIYPGMLVKVAFVTGETERLLVPSQAVVHRSEVTGVYVADREGRVTLRQVRAGKVYPDGLTEVLAGLQAGEQVALDPIRAGVYLKGREAGDGQ